MSINNNPWFIIAPHLQFPLRSGGDLYAAGVAKGLSYFIDEITLVGASATVEYGHGQEKKRINHPGVLRSQKKAALITLAKRSSYPAEKFITTAFLKKLKALNVPADANIAYSTISCAKLASYFPHIKGKQVVLTHNFDPDYFQKLYEAATNPLAKLTLRQTYRWLNTFLQKNQDRFIFAHNNEADEANYLRLFPAMHNTLFKVGVDEPYLDTVVQLKQQKNSKPPIVRLCFAGALSGIQNLEALQYFRNRFWEPMQKVLGKNLQFYVIGSNPMPGVLKLCAENNWQLRADLNSDDFAEAIASCHFSVLPFEFTSGTKHKLFTSMAQGVPFIATTCIAVQVGEIPDTCMFSDDADAWSAHIIRYLATLTEEGTIDQLINFVKQHSWKKSAAAFLASEEMNKAWLGEDFN